MRLLARLAVAALVLSSLFVPIEATATPAPKACAAFSWPYIASTVNDCTYQTESGTQQANVVGVPYGWGVWVSTSRNGAQTAIYRCLNPCTNRAGTFHVRHGLWVHLSVFPNVVSFVALPRPAVGVLRDK